MEPIAIIEMFYGNQPKTLEILVEHGRLVAQKALAVAENVRHLKPDCEFIKEAAMLHDIGIFMTRAPSLGCHGEAAYVCHGFLGRQILEKMGLHRHALVCERHVGVGLSAADIKLQGLPLPQRDMIPVSIEEQIVCYADKFFSKNGSSGASCKSVETIKCDLTSHGSGYALKFQSWVERFEKQP